MFAGVLGPMAAANRVAWGGSPPLRALLESAAFRASTSSLTIPIGEDCAGDAHVADLARLPHLLVTGMPGYGKTTFVRALVATLLLRNGADDLHVCLYSGDASSFRAFDGAPQLLAPATSDPEAAAAYLEWARGEMDRRFALLRAAGVRNIGEFNRVPPLVGLMGVPPHPAGQPWTLRRLVAVFDDVEGLRGQWGTDVVAATGDLLLMGRAVGMHLVMATGDRRDDALPGRLKAGMLARLSFRQPSTAHSAVAVYAGGAEELTEPGEALFLPPTEKAPVSVRVAPLEEETIRRVVAHMGLVRAGTAEAPV